MEGPVGGGDDSSQLGDFIEDEMLSNRWMPPHERCCANRCKARLRRSPNGSVRCLELRFGLLDGKDHTLEEVSRYFKVTRERIRQIEAKALRKLRHPTRSRHLRDYLG